MKKIEIVVGIICILFLYTIPVPIYPPPHSIYVGTSGASTGQIMPCSQPSTLTISQLSGSVSNPFVMGSMSTCSSAIGGPSYELYTGLFYIGWIIGILCVLYGFSK
jgi:hypothetical protein